MTVQATGARRLTLTRPEPAREAFAAIETTGREALDELRRLLGVLRREDVEVSLAPQPSLRHARSLARRTAAAGLPVACGSRARSANCRPASTSPPTASSRTRSRPRLSTAAPAAPTCASLRAETLELEVRDDGPSSARAR